MSPKRIVLLVLILFFFAIPGCISTSGGAWHFDSAAKPEGWPESTPVGEVELREYPTYRAAEVSRGELDGDAMSPMFMQLFRHIDGNDIAMTAPVEMTYDDAPDPSMTTMAFMYRSQAIGETGMDGVVAVRDVEPELFASTGVRGSYDEDTYLEGRARLEAWLADNADGYRAAGPFRYLGYNGPFTLWFLRYGEVQVPVEPVGQAR